MALYHSNRNLTKKKVSVYRNLPLVFRNALAKDGYGRHNEEKTEPVRLRIHAERQTEAAQASSASDTWELWVL